MMRKNGTREELVAALREDVGYWGFIGNDKNLTAAVDGAKALEAGSCSVKVGHTIYSVVVDSSDEAGSTR